MESIKEENKLIFKLKKYDSNFKSVFLSFKSTYVSKVSLQPSVKHIDASKKTEKSSIVAEALAPMPMSINSALAS